MTFYFIIIIIIGALVVDVISYNPMLTYVPRFKKIEVQPNFTIANYTIDRYKDIQFVNAHITINSKELINKVIGVFYRCDPDGINCEYFQTWTFRGVCDLLKQKNQIWSRWYESFDPPMVCPINKVHYQIKNGSFEVGPAILLYPLVTDYQWKLIQKFYADELFVGSYMIEMSFFGYRKKIKSILKP